MRVGSLLAAALLIACVTPDSLMRRSLSRGQPDEAEQARWLADYAADTRNHAGLRAWALRSSSRLAKQPPDAVEKLGRIVANPHEESVVRSWAAYALGELRTAAAIPALGQALQGDIDPGTSYYVLEALAKELPDILQDQNANDAVAATLASFVTQHPDAESDMFDLIDNKVTNLRTLANRLQRLSAGQPDPAELYTTVYRAFERFAASRRRCQLGRDTTDAKLLIDLSFKALPGADVMLERHVVWYAGLLADCPPIAALCVDPLLHVSTKDVSLRPIEAWSLARLQSDYPEAKNALAALLASEKDEQILRMLGELAVVQQEPGTGAGH